MPSRRMVVEQNPYAPTRAALNEVSPQEERSESLEPAPRWRRLVNLLLDFVGILLTSMLLGLVLGVASVTMHIDVAPYRGQFFG
jgi:anti-sigma factor RsiW